MLFSQKPAITFVLLKHIGQVAVKQTIAVFSHVFKNIYDSLSVIGKAALWFYHFYECCCFKLTGSRLLSTHQAVCQFR